MPESYGNGKKHGAAESHILKNITMGKLSPGQTARDSRW